MITDSVWDSRRQQEIREYESRQIERAAVEREAQARFDEIMVQNQKTGSDATEFWQRDTTPTQAALQREQQLLQNELEQSALAGQTSQARISPSLVDTALSSVRNNFSASAESLILSQKLAQTQNSQPLAFNNYLASDAARAAQVRLDSSTTQNERLLRTQLEGRALEQKLSQSSLTAELLEQKTLDAGLNASALAAQSANRSADAKAASQHATEAKDQAEWLQTGRQASKDAAGAVHRHARVAVPQGRGQNTVAQALAPSAASISSSAQLVASSSNSAASMPADTVEASPALMAPLTALLAQFKESVGIPTTGTQRASKEAEPMAAYFSTSYDAARDQKRQDPRRQANSPEEMLDVTHFTRVRQSALVDRRSQDLYSATVIREGFMPKLCEVVQKLSAMEQSWARMVIPVDAQTKVEVRFNNTAGRIKIHMTTTSGALADLIKDGWSWLLGETAKHGVSVDEPTFETNTYVN